ncbi:MULTISPECIES: response regulator [unclassified Chryseobacterium]|uniref:response regulator n=1 Tax=unclassified Chryseobacterium TaxID=2593645 RepID=UPI0012CA1F6D|nr:MULTISPECIES: response regulator [unclassified Chryseobacterium]MPS64923.1 response regulator [Chryseobacterium sp.]UMQ41256.1 response regulator [Chryseobacterium sp. Y16C]
MNKEFLNATLLDSNVHSLILLRKILQEHKIKIRCTDFYSDEDLSQYLNKAMYGVPDVVFINYQDIQATDFLLIRERIDDIRYSSAIFVVYSNELEESEIENILISGANIFLKLNDDYSKLKKMVSEIITMIWQYQTSGLNRSNFIMKMG